MDDLGNIFYILFAIVAIIFNVMRKGKKANPSTPPPVDNDNNNDPFEDMIPKFEQLFKPEESPKPQPEVITTPVAEKKAPKFKPKPQPPVNDFEEKKRQLQSVTTRIPKQKTTEKPIKISSEHTESSWFDAKQAVIYSEILKRPEF